MADIGHFCAPHRIAVWLEHRDDYLEIMSPLWHLLRGLSAQVDWGSLPSYQPPILAVYFGSIVNHEFTLQEVGQDMVWCSMIGAPTPEIKAEVQKVIDLSPPNGLIRVDPNPPLPFHPFYCLMLYGLLAHQTLIRMESGNRRRYEHIVGIEVVHPDELEVTLLTALSDNEALPTLVSVMARNLRRWISEPKPNAGVDRLIQHAYELQYIGAFRAAGVVAGQALELLLVQWNAIPSERVKTEKLMLGTLITEAQIALNLSESTVGQLREFSKLRAKCAHALVDNSMGDAEFNDEISDFLDWLSKNQQFAARATPHSKPVAHGSEGRSANVA